MYSTLADSRFDRTHLIYSFLFSSFILIQEVVWSSSWPHIV